MGGRRIWLFRGIALAISLLLSFGLLEIGLRSSQAYGGQAYSVNPTGSQYKFYMFDPELGWANAPHMRGTYEREEFSFPIRVNEYGMRDAPVERAHGDRSRIAVLGDSFTWGIGVADEERYSERMEASLGIEVLNFGVSGYSPVQYRLMLDDVLSFEPDLVLLAFCLGNDFGDNVYFERHGYYKPYAELDDAGEIVLRGYPLPNVDDFGFREIGEGSILVRMVKSAIEKLFLPEQRGLLGFRNKMIYKVDELGPEERSRVEQAIRINEALLREIRDGVEAGGSTLVLLPVPTKCEYSERCRTDNSALRDDAYLILEETADRLGIRLVPTLDAIDGRDFWEEDGHWRPSGHARIAARVGDYLVGEGLLQ
jgi:hypothetical protein